MEDTNNNSVQQTQQTPTGTEGLASSGDTHIIENKSGMSVSINSSGNNVDGALDAALNDDNNNTQQNGQNTSTQTTQQQNPQPTVNQQLNDAHSALNAAESDLKAKGVDFTALEKEFQTNGSLSQDSYNQLANAGYPESVVKGVLNGWQAATDSYVNEVTNMAGGRENLTKMQQFVLSQGDTMKKAYNNAINSEDLGQIQLVFAGIKSQMDKAYGTSNATIIGGTAPAVSHEGYETTAEMVKDMSDPRYQTDAKFTEAVYRKVKYSKIF